MHTGMLTDRAVRARSQRRQGAAAGHDVMAMEGPRKGWRAWGGWGALRPVCAPAGALSDVPCRGLGVAKQ